MAVPMALRSKPSTMMMRVKPVIISKAAGRKDSEVISSSVCMLSEYVCAPPGPGVAVRAGRVACAKPLAGNSARPASARAASAGGRPRRRSENCCLMSGGAGVMRGVSMPGPVCRRKRRVRWPPAAVRRLARCAMWRSGWALRPLPARYPRPATARRSGAARASGWPPGAAVRPGCGLQGQRGAPARPIAEWRPGPAAIPAPRAARPIRSWRSAAVVQAVDALGRRDDVRQAYAIFVFDDDNLALCDQVAVDEDVHGFAGQSVEFDDRALAQLQQVLDCQAGGSQFHSQLDGHVHDQVDVAALAAHVVGQRLEHRPTCG